VIEIFSPGQAARRLSEIYGRFLGKQKTMTGDE